MLETPFELLRIIQEEASPFPYNKSIQEWKAQGGMVCGWACIYVPEELVYAAGLLPIRISGDNEEAKLDTAESYLYINSCSLAKTCLELGLDGRYDFLDGFILGETCDGVRRLFDVWERYLPTSFMYVYGVPRKFTQHAYDLYKKELLELKKGLETFIGREITTEDLHEAITLYNDTRTLLQQLYQLRKKENPPITGAEILEILKAAVRIPRKKFNLLLKQLVAQVESTSRKIDYKCRIMLIGSILNNSDFVRCIEELGGLVVTDELCTGTRYFWEKIDEDIDPWEAMAKYYLGRPPCARFIPSEKRFHHIFNMIDSFQVDGVISEIIRYCVPYGHDQPLLIEELQQRDIPILNLDLEYGMGGTGQIKTRAEAFIEMLTVKATKEY
jgi:benzoyl-CoA reductase subunit C